MLLKGDSVRGVFLLILRNFYMQFYNMTPPRTCATNDETGINWSNILENNFFFIFATKCLHKKSNTSTLEIRFFFALKLL